MIRELFRRSSTSRHHAAFTLIELLVVIAIIALLVSLLLPALAEARYVAKQLKAQVASREQNNGYLIYANDHRGDVMQGFLHYTAGHRIDAMRPNHNGYHLEGWTIKRYPWRLAEWLDYNFEAMVHDEDLLRTMLARPEAQPNRTEGTAQVVYDVRTSFEWIFAAHSSLGLNTVFVGGDYEYGGTQVILGEDQGFKTRGKYVVKNITDVFRTSDQIIFSTARGTLTQGGTNAPLVPGYHRVIAPSTPSSGGNAGLEGTSPTGWYAPIRANPRGTFFWFSDPRRDPNQFGYIDYRWKNKAITTHFDGSTAFQDVEEMVDMRKWCNWANLPNSQVRSWTLISPN